MGILVFDFSVLLFWVGLCYVVFGVFFVQLRIKINFNRCTLVPSVLEQNHLVLVQVFKGLVLPGDE